MLTLLTSRVLNRVSLHANYSRKFCLSAVQYQETKQRTSFLSQNFQKNQHENTHDTATGTEKDDDIERDLIPGKDSNIQTVDKPLTNTPFVKNLFLGQFDTDIFVYPELSSNEELNDLEQLVDPVRRYFEEAVNSEDIDQSCVIPDRTVQDLKDLGLYGQQVPIEYGGLGLNQTQYARLSEETCRDASIGVLLGAHQSIGFKGIQQAGTPEQKEKYLTKCASGEWTAAFCLTEPTSGSDAASIKTRATLSADGKHFILNGSKAWISNGGIADMFTVLAKTEVPDKEKGGLKDAMTAFIVERSFGGVTSGKPEDKMGIRGSNTCDVFFENTPVPIENVLGEVGGGFKVAMNILNSGRFSMGATGAASLRRMMAVAAEYALTRKQFGKTINNFELIKEKFGKMAVAIYAMESMAYMTCGIMDQYQRPDTSIEAAIVKVFSSENLWHFTSECLQIHGGVGYMKSLPFERYLRDIRILMIFEGTNEILRLYIALTCLQHAGRQLRDLVRKLRDPLNNVGLLYKRSIKMFSNSFENPRLTLKLNEFLHPNLEVPAKLLERRVLKLSNHTEILLSKYGKDIAEKQMLLKRLADVVIDLYGMTAVLSRSSRSICIGLRNCDHERKLALSFCWEACKRIDRNFEELKIGSDTSDENYMEIADEIFKKKGYAAEHPLKRNW